MIRHLRADALGGPLRELATTLRPRGIGRLIGHTVFTVILLVALLPVVGVYGAAIASTVAYGVALVMMLLSLRTLPSESSGPRHRRRRADQDQSQGA